MNILILGATGNTGREVVAQALAAGDTVTAFVRDSQKLGRNDGSSVRQSRVVTSQ